MTAELPLPPRFRVLEVLQRDEVQVRLRVADEVLQRELVLELPGRARLAELDRGGQKARILREARMLAKVHHAGVQGILEVMEHEGVPILLLAPRQGRTLEDLLHEHSRLEPADVQRIGVQVAEAAQAMHAAGVVHRDLREANILLAADGSCVLTGFSFAKPQGSPFHGTSLNYGKRGGREPDAPLLPTYPAPEQLRGAAADARTDVYGLGCVLAHCLTGTAPKPEQTLSAAALLQKAPAAPRRLVEAIAGCLAPAPSARFPTMQAVANELQQQEAPSRVVSRRMLLAAAAAVALLAPLGWVLAKGGGPPPAPDASRGRDAKADRIDRDWYREGHAVVIGINYQGAPGRHPELNNAERDAAAVAGSLRKLGWQDVTSLTGGDATRDGIMRAIAKLQDARPEDQVLVYFAGHGKRHKHTANSAWLLPYDADEEPDPFTEPSNWIKMTQVQGWLGDEIPARHILVALDTCYSGAAVHLGQARGSETLSRENVKRLLAGRARKVIASSSRTAADGTAGHSPFCQVFLDCLALTEDRCLTASEMHARLQLRLLEETRGFQVPLQGAPESSDPESDFVFGHYR